MAQIMKSMMGLPLWVQLWLPVLFGTNLASLAFLDTEVGRMTAIAFTVVCLFNLPMMFVQRGLTRLLAIPHFAWLPLLVYLYGQLLGAEPLRAGSVRTYALVVFGCNTFSLLFDVIDTFKWFRGQREVLGLENS
jgi:hypothetical protein